MRIRKCWYVILLATMMTGGCAGNMGDTVSGNDTAPGSKEVIVRLCADVSQQQAETILARYSLWVSRRLSSNLLVMEWNDERSASNVISDLEGVNGICMVQPNYGYEASPAEQGTPK